MKDAAFYRALPYTRSVTIHVEPDGSVLYVARVAEIPPLRIHGTTPEEALKNLSEVFDDIIGSMIEGGEEIPEPVPFPFNYGALAGHGPHLVAAPAGTVKEIDIPNPRAKRGWVKPLRTGVCC